MLGPRAASQLGLERVTASIKVLKSTQKPSMSRPTPKPDKRAKTQPVPPEVVSPIWLVKAIALTLLAALFCGYLTFCLLFYQGQWQFVLHPTRTSGNPSSLVGIPYETLRFGPDESATPQLTGWWIPSGQIPSDPGGGHYSHLTILFLPDGNGSLADSIPTLASLHNLGLNVFAFDYRGYGQSAALRPGEQSMIHDADIALQYLTTSRAIPTAQIIPYGTGVGASLATHLAISNSTIPALILDSPRADLLDVAMHDPRATLIPVRLLFHERFPLAEPLSTLRTPKLLLSRATSAYPAFVTASDPKLTVELASTSSLLYSQSLTRFLDQYLPHAPLPSLVPSTAPAR
jgi:uncharacterized protein